MKSKSVDWGTMLIGVIASAWMFYRVDLPLVRLLSTGVFFSSLAALIASRRQSSLAAVFAGSAYSFLLVYFAWSISQVGPTIFRVICFGLSVYYAWDYFRAWKTPAEEDEENDKPMISIVGLVEELPFLDETVLARHVRSAWGLDLSTGDGDGDATAFIVGEAPLFCINCDRGMFIVHYFDQPYFDNSEEVAAQSRNMRLSHAVENHRAWFSVDLMTGSDDPDRLAEDFADVGRLFAEIVDDDCLGIVLPALDQLLPWEPEFGDALRSGDPLSAMCPELAPVIRVDDDDPRMQAAVSEARERFGEFEEAFRRRTNDEEPFSVKAPITAGGNTEFIWIMVTGIENDVIYGTLGNDPVDLGNLKEGDQVHVSVSDLNDWMYMNGDDYEGGFTVKLLMEISGEPTEDSDRDS